MKNVFLYLIVWLSCATTVAQIPTFDWAVNLGGSNNDVGYSVATDAAGNVYTTGYFSGTADFDPGTGIFNLASNGGKDIFISKLDGSGNFLWAKSIGGSFDDYGYSITTDSAGNIYCTGQFEGTVDFDPNAGTQNLFGNGGTDIFVLKLSPTGNLIWAKRIGGNLDDFGASIDIGASGGVYTTGYFKGNVDFDPGAGTFNLNATGNEDIFISKLDASGNFVWAKKIGDSSVDFGLSVKVDASGSIYTAGYFSGTPDFDPGVGTFNMTSSGRDIFILKLNATGNFVWARKMGGTNSDYAYSMAIDPNGYIYTTGHFQGTADFDPGSSTYNLTASSVDCFISKLDTSGNFVWAKNFDGTAADYGQGIATDHSGNIYLTGYFNGTTDLDPGAGTFSLTSLSTDVFIVKLDFSGSFIWGMQIGSTSTNSGDNGYSIAVDNQESIYTTGFFQNTSDFDPGAGTHNVTANGAQEAYVLKLNKCAFETSTDLIAACSGYTWRDGNTYTTNNNTATHTVPGVATGGCDSVYYLNLMINSATASTISPTACFSYTSPGGKVFTSSGTYSDTILNALSCDSIITINLTLNTVDTSVNKVGTTLTSNEAGATYQWLDCNNNYNAITGAINVSYAPPTNGSYAVEITKNGCTDTSACRTITGVGINSSYVKHISVHPNPTNGIVTIDLGNGNEVTEYAVTTADGRIVTSKTQVTGSKIIIDLTGVDQGIYLIHLTSNSQMQTVKLVKQDD